MSAVVLVRRILAALFALALLLGGLLGGLIARQWGLTAPWWFAFVGSGVTLALVWRSLAQIAHADEAATAAAQPDPA